MKQSYERLFWAAYMRSHYWAGSALLAGLAVAGIAFFATGGERQRYEAVRSTTS